MKYHPTTIFHRRFLYVICAICTTGKETGVRGVRQYVVQRRVFQCGRLHRLRRDVLLHRTVAQEVPVLGTCSSGSPNRSLHRSETSAWKAAKGGMMETCNNCKQQFPWIPFATDPVVCSVWCDKELREKPTEVQDALPREAVRRTVLP